LAELDPLVARLPGGPPETLNVRGDVYRAMGDLENAEKDYRRLIGLRPKDPNAHIGLALVYQKQGKSEEAKACYDQLIAADTGSALAYLRRAEFRRDHNQFEPALAGCDGAARRGKEPALPGLGRASLERADGPPRRAGGRGRGRPEDGPAA